MVLIILPLWRSLFKAALKSSARGDAFTMNKCDERCRCALVIPCCATSPKFIPTGVLSQALGSIEAQVLLTPCVSDTYFTVYETREVRAS